MTKSPEQLDAELLTIEAERRFYRRVLVRLERGECPRTSAEAFMIALDVADEVGVDPRALVRVIWDGE